MMDQKKRDVTISHLISDVLKLGPSGGPINIDIPEQVINALADARKRAQAWDEIRGLVQKSSDVVACNILKAMDSLIPLTPQTVLEKMSEWCDSLPPVHVVAVSEIRAQINRLKDEGESK